MDRREFLQASAFTVADMWMPASQAGATAETGNSETSIYVAPHGSDSNPGTRQQPFASLQRAQHEARALKQHTTQPITVWVRGGTYYLEAPLVFTPEDSGTSEAPISYMAYPQEIVTISGGRKLNCRWKPFKSGIMQCSVSDGKQKPLNFTQLFVDGKRQVRARYPNYDPQKPSRIRCRLYRCAARRLSLACNGISFQPSDFYQDPVEPSTGSGCPPISTRLLGQPPMGGAGRRLE